jgi:nucleotide-binding universal stress UspA family protein
MTTNLIVSYDGTSNDDDALALGKLLGQTGATLALAYVRHSREFDPRREELAEHDANRRLEHGAAGLGDPDVARHIVVSASTGAGLEELATAEDASVIVFGSDYRTPPGHAEPGNTAQHLIEGGSVAIAVAAAGLRTRADAAIKWIAIANDGDGAAQQTADLLASRLGATIVEAGEADLIVVGSHAGGLSGRIALSGASRSMLSSAHGSVLILPAGKPAQL